MEIAKINKIQCFTAMFFLPVMVAAFSPDGYWVTVQTGQTVEIGIGTLPVGTMIKWDIYCDVNADFTVPPENCDKSRFYFVNGNESSDISLVFLEPGEHMVKVESWDAEGCSNNMKFFRIDVIADTPPLLDMGPTVISCNEEKIFLDSIRAENYSKLKWSSSGDGLFENPEDLHTVYYPGQTDILNGMVTLSLTATGDCKSDLCPDVKGDLIIHLTSLEISLDLTHPSCHDSKNGSAMAEISGGNPAYKLSWTGPDDFKSVDESVRDLPPGKYVLTASDASGCEKTLEFELDKPEKLTASIQTYYQGDCESISVQLSGHAAGGIGGYLYQWSGDPVTLSFLSNQNSKDPVFSSNAPEGLYTLICRISDENGCGTEDTIRFYKHDKLIVSEKHYPISTYGANDGMINLNLSGGIPFDSGDYSILWEGPDGFFSREKNLINLGPGEYTAVISDSMGCTAKVSVTIIEPSPGMILTPPPPIKICTSGIIVPAFSGIEAFLNAGGKVKAECPDGITPASFRMISQISDKQSCPETITRIYELHDQCGNNTICEHIIILDDNEPPLVQPPAFFRIQCLADFQALHKPVPAISGFISIGGRVSDNCLSDNSQFTIRWLGDERKTNNDCRDTIIRRYVILDKCNNHTMVEIPYYLSDSRPPEIVAAPWSLHAECEVPPPYNEIQDFRDAGGIVNDNCGSLNIKHITDETLTGFCPKTIHRSYLLTDDCGNSVTFVQTITIEDLEKPVISVPAPLTLDCTGGNGNDLLKNWLESVIATDNCDNPLLSNNFNSLKIACGSPATVTFTATDACGNQTSATSQLSVMDDVPPVFDPVIPLILDCGSADLDKRIQAWLNSVSARDNCGQATIIHNYEVKTRRCGEQQFVTFTATDNCGNISTTTSMITVKDTTAPLISVINPLEIECNDLDAGGRISVWLQGVTATDMCGKVLVSNDFKELAQSCGEPTSVIFTATDECGNKSTKLSTITIIDRQKPVFNVVPPLVIDCSSGKVNDQIHSWLNAVTAVDNCGFVRITHDYSGYHGRCGQPIIVNFSAEDGCGNIETTSGTITVIDKTAPTWGVQIKPLIINCAAGDAGKQIEKWINTISAFDNCGTAEVTHNFTGHSHPCGEKVPVTFTATDVCGNYRTFNTSVTITDDQPPVFSAIEPFSLSCSAGNTDENLKNWLRSAKATDNCGVPAVSYDIEWPVDPCAGSATVTFTATDDCGLTSVLTSTFTITDNTPPVFDPINPLIISCEADNTTKLIDDWLIRVSAKDDCGWVSIQNDYRSEPAGLLETDEIIVSFTAIDACGNSASAAGSIIIKKRAKTELSLSADTLTVCRGTPVNLLAKPANAGPHPVYRWYVNGIQIDETLSPSFSYVPSENVTVYAEILSDDPCGKALPVQSDTLLINVSDTLYPFISIKADSGEICEMTPVTIYADIHNGGENPEIRWYVNGEIIPGETGLSFQYIPSVGDKVYAAVISAEHCASGIPVVSDTLEFNIINNLPVILNCPVDVEIACSGNFKADLTAEDFVLNGWIINPDIAELTTFRKDSSFSRSVSTSILTITYSISDICGKQSSCTQKITLIDKEPPVVLCQNITVHLDSTGQFLVKDEDFIAMASDNCSLYENLVIESTQSPKGCMYTGKTIPVTVTVTDEAGNKSSCSSEISVRDTLKPVAICRDAEILTDADGWASVNPKQLDGGSNDNCRIDQMWLDKTDFQCDDNNQTVTLHIRDISGNENSCRAMVSVRDTTPPLAVCRDWVLELGPDGVAQLSPEVLDNGSSDNCGVREIWLSQTKFTCEHLGINKIYLQAIDYHDNISTCTASVNVRGNLPPDARNDFVKALAGQNTMILVTLNDTDPDGILDQTSLTIHSLPANGTIMPLNNTFIYRPENGFLGSDSFSYRICDDGGNCGPFCDTATVSIHVIPENLAPLAVDDNYEAGCLAITGNVLANDYDPDGNEIMLDMSWIKLPEYGNLEVFADGSFIYFSGKNFAGQDMFYYRICDDGYPVKCDTATVLLNVFKDEDCNGIPDEVLKDFFAPEGFSPNGDGINDVFRIIGLERFPNARITIYNRLGKRVFEMDNYGNNKFWGSDEKSWWNGTSNYPDDFEEVRVPEGNYLFILVFGNGPHYRGTVMVTY